MMTESLQIRADRAAERYISGCEPGCSVLAARGGEVILKSAYGMADIENGIPVKPEDNFIIASNTKQFACLAVLMLRDRGLLALDETIERFFPGFPDYRKKVTVRMLMNHTSGIAEYFEDEYWRLNDRFALADTAEMIRIAATLDDKTKFEPGTEFSYCNTAYVMIGDIVRQLSGKSFGNFLETEIFAPLGMDRSFAPDYMDQKDPYQVEGYQYDEALKTFVKVPYDMLEVGYADGNISSNTEDLLKWHDFLYRGGNAGLVSRETLKELYTPGHLNDGTEINYGFGIMTGDLDGDHKSVTGHRELWHTGGTMGFISRVSYFPDDDVSIIMLTNRNGIDRDGLFGGFAEAVFTSIRDGVI